MLQKIISEKCVTMEKTKKKTEEKEWSFKLKLKCFQCQKGLLEDDDAN